MAAGLSALLFHSCRFTEDDIFGQSASERTEAAVSEYRRILTSAPNGWIMEYYAGGNNHDIGGVTWLLRFDGEDVTVASDTEVQGYNEDIPVEPGEAVTSKYALLAEQMPMLSFSTYNTLIHYWSEPRGGLDADGYQGDFEFFILSATEQQVTLKGKKYGSLYTLRRMADGTAWDDYLDGCRKVRSQSEEWGTLVGYNGSEVFASSVVSFLGVLRYDENGKQQKVAFAYTDTGITLYKPVTINGVKLNDFTWVEADKKFVSTTDSRVCLKYERPTDYLPIEFYTEYNWDLAYTKTWAQTDTVEHVTFERIEDPLTGEPTDTLATQVEALGLKFPIKAVYNHSTGMIELLTQFSEMVVLSIIDDSGERTLDAYIHLCPWNNDEGIMYLVNTAGIVSYTEQETPRILKFRDNGRTSGSDLNGFVLYGFEEYERTSPQLGVLETFNDITLIQKDRRR